MALGVRSPRGGPKAVAAPTMRPSFVLGSRPASLRAPPPPRIKPGPPGTTQYGKVPIGNSAAIGSGDTGLTGMS
jgi:hypothetical protein